MARKKNHTRGLANMGNDALAKAMVEKRRSNAAGIHADKRTKRVRTRSAAMRRALADY